MRNNIQHFGASPYIKKNVVMAFFPHHQSESVCGVLQAVCEIRSAENDRDCKRQTFKSQGRRVYCEAE